MNYKIASKLEKFLNDKMSKIYDKTRYENHQFDLRYIQTKGFGSNIQKGYYEFNKSNDSRNILHFYRKNKREVVRIKIDDISSNGWYGNVGMLYLCMDKIDEIALELYKFKGELEKQEKIDQIAKNSIKTWLKAMFKNQPYSYYTIVSDNKITLSVKLKKSIQLDIPIYYKNFQKIMPELLNTIQQFEKTANDSKIKVLISNSAIGQKWITGE